MSRKGEAPLRGLDALSLEGLIKAAEVPPSLFLCGEEAGLREFLVDKLRDFHRRGGSEISALSAEEEGPAAVLDRVLQGGLFASRRFLVIRDAEALTEKKSTRLPPQDQERLEEALSRPPEGCALALVSGRLDRKREALERAFTRAAGRWMGVYVCAPLGSSAFERFCQARAAEQSLKLAPDDLAALAALTGGRVGLASREIERMAVSGKSQAGAPPQAPWGAVFHWVDDLLRGRPRSPVELGEAGAEDALMTLGLLRSRYKLALDMAAGRGGGPPLPPDSREALEGAARRLGRKGLEDVLLSLAGLDLSLRRGALEPPEALASAALLGLPVKA